MKSIWMSALLVIIGLCSVTSAAWPSTINYNHPNNWAESGSYSKVLDRFITGAGANPPYHLLKIDRRGVATQFATDDRFAAPDILTQGVKVDDERGRVYFVAANISLLFGSPPTPGRFQSGFAEADLFTGEILRYIDLSNIVASGVVSANDLVRHEDGTFFLTDLFGRILRIARNNEVSIFSEAEQLKRVTLSGVNGIVLLDRDNLLVGNYDLSTLAKVHIPSRRVTNVPIKNGGIVNPDGIVFGPDGALYVAQNVQGASRTTIARLVSHDQWHTARKTREGTSSFGSGSAVIFRKNAAYVTHAGTYPPPNTGVFDRVRFD